VTFAKSVRELSLHGKAPRHLDRSRREIKPGDDGAASREAKRVPPDMALQMQDSLSGNVAEFGRFDHNEVRLLPPENGRACRRELRGRGSPRAHPNSGD
jgi:hypothetical protein